MIGSQSSSLYNFGKSTPSISGGALVVDCAYAGVHQASVSTALTALNLSLTKVKNGSSGRIRLVKESSSNVVITFGGTGFTHLELGATSEGTALTTSTLSGAADTQFFLEFNVHSSTAGVFTIYWKITTDGGSSTSNSFEKYLFVNPDSAYSGTGVKGDPTKPYLTCALANADAVTGDKIWVLGNITGSLPLKDGVDYVGHGVTITCTSGYLFNDNFASCEVNLLGHFNIAINGGQFSFLRGADTKLRIQGDLSSSGSLGMDSSALTTGFVEINGNVDVVNGVGSLIDNLTINGNVTSTTSSTGQLLFSGDNIVVHGNVTTNGAFPFYNSTGVRVFGDVVTTSNQAFFTCSDVEIKGDVTAKLQCLYNTSTTKIYGSLNCSETGNNSTNFLIDGGSDIKVYGDLTSTITGYALSAGGASGSTRLEVYGEMLVDGKAYTGCTDVLHVGNVVVDNSGQNNTMDAVIDGNTRIEFRGNIDLNCHCQGNIEISGNTGLVIKGNVTSTFTGAKTAMIQSDSDSDVFENCTLTVPLTYTNSITSNVQRVITVKGFFEKNKPFNNIALNTFVNDKLEVFVGIGQSNMKGQNTGSNLSNFARYDQVLDKVSVWNGSTAEIMQASDLFNNQFPEVDDSISHIVSAALDYSLNTGKRVLVFVFAVGGIPLYDSGNASTWNVNSTSTSGVWDRFEDQITLFKAYLSSNNIDYNYRLVIIDQGEGDASSSTRATAYQTNYSDWIDELRIHFGQVNIYKVLQYFTNTTFSDTATVRTAELAIDALNDKVFSIEKDGYDNVGDNIHTDVYGQLAIGSEIAMMETGNFIHTDNFNGTTLDSFWSITNNNPANVSIEVDNKLKFTKLLNSSGNWEDRVLSTDSYSGTMVMSSWLYRTSPGVGNEPNGGFGLYYDDDNYAYIGFNNPSGNAGEVRIILRFSGTTRINQSPGIADQQLFRIAFNDETTIAQFQYNDKTDGVWKDLIPSESWDMSQGQSLSGRFGFFMAAQNSGGLEFHFRKVTCGRKRHTSIFSV